MTRATGPAPTAVDSQNGPGMPVAPATTRRRVIMDGLNSDTTSIGPAPQVPSGWGASNAFTSRTVVYALLCLTIVLVL